MQSEHTEGQREGLLTRLDELGLRGQEIYGESRTVIAVLGAVFPELRDELSVMPGVDDVVRISRAYKLSSREVKPEDTVVDVGYGVQVGGGRTVLMAGPCAVESEQQMMAAARGVRAGGAHVLRGGAFKPRTSPYSFQGLGEEGLLLLAAAGRETGMPVITELLSVRDVDVVAQHADILQIGARNMQNFVLLSEAGRTGKPVMLKRGLAGTVEEWLLAAEYILQEDNPNVILCERGVRTFETAYRNTMDLNAIALARRLSHLPVIADPSHGTGRWYLVEPLSAASIAAGADGLMIEVHPNPDQALSDGAQSLTPKNFAEVVESVSTIADAVGRPLAPAPVPVA